MSTIGNSPRPIGEPNWSSSQAAQGTPTPQTPPEQLSAPPAMPQAAAPADSTSEVKTDSTRTYELKNQVSFGQSLSESQSVNIQPVAKLQPASDTESQSSIFLNAALQPVSEAVQAFRANFSSVSEEELQSALMQAALQRVASDINLP
ncbi:MAG: hypothetical protein IGS03_09795 [Candidatus Sericytochromatia bacterium]|nr:hypothetical protein [Candidatus Sericytochromatia bacterium]